MSRDVHVRAALSGADPRAALAIFEGEDCPTVDCLLERGHLEYLAGDYGAAQRDLEAAEYRIQDLWTLNLGKEAASLAVNDLVRDYGGESFEKVWVNWVRALAYLAEGEPWEAAVEGRALSRKLTVMADRGDDASGYHNDPFLQYFAGLLAEADGDLNRAWVNYRAAERLYAATEVYGPPAPPSLGADMVRCAERLSFGEEAEALRERYGEPASPESGEGEVVLLVSEGLSPSKINERIDFPIFEDEDEEHGRDAWRVATYSYDHWHSPPREVDYWLSIALPSIAPSTPAPSLDWHADGRRGELALAADLGKISRRNLEDRYARVVIRTLARALVKYWAAEKAKEKKGEVAGMLVNLLGSASEWADTRGWASLPERVQMARIALPAGEYRLRVESAEGEVTIVPGGLSFLHLRLY